MSTPSRRTSTGWALTGATASSTARDYFEKDYEYAVELIKKGLAYVCELTPEQLKEYRGDIAHPARSAPIATGRIEENLDLFERMRDWRIPRRSKCTLRAKIDLASRQLQYARPGHLPHPLHAPSPHRATSGASIRCTTSRTPFRMRSRASPIRSARWSLRTHRPLYDWVVNNVSVPVPVRARSSLPASASTTQS